MAFPVDSKKKQLYLAIIVLLLVVVALLWRSESGAPEPLEQEIPIAQGEVQKILDAGNRDLARANEALSNAQKALENPAKTSTPGNPQAAQPIATPAWQPADSNTVAMPLPDGVVIYEPVSVDMESPGYPQPGEKISFTLPGGKNLSATVTTSNENPNGDYSWRGYLDGEGTDYPVVMTYGTNSVFATITTPEGSYTLESMNGSGWVYKNPAEFELSEPGKNDYLEIPHSHIHE